MMHYGHSRFAGLAPVRASQLAYGRMSRPIHVTIQYQESYNMAVSVAPKGARDLLGSDGHG